MLTLSRSAPARNDSSNFYITQHGYNTYRSLEKNKKTLRKMFSETNYIEQDSSKNYLASVKLIVCLNVCFPCKSYVVHTMNIKRLKVRNVIP